MASRQSGEKCDTIKLNRFGRMKRLVCRLSRYFVFRIHSGAFRLNYPFFVVRQGVGKMTWLLHMHSSGLLLCVNRLKATASTDIESISIFKNSLFNIQSP